MHSFDAAISLRHISKRHTFLRSWDKWFASGAIKLAAVRPSRTRKGSHVRSLRPSPPPPQSLDGRLGAGSPHRANRPWQGQQEAADRAPRPAHDPDCYLCAGNLRVNGERNPDYAGSWVFPNDFAALLSA
jgi:hypothetical protein